ncbi:GNAT family N-acetyltransferase [Defluviitalea saccharophila]|uniref:GNAT family N-acetyltransferase n=1 Tax=Defluviitalea saccharophila TaxID=879970 RepID=A0ABZ2Y9R0_9FIRM
MINIRKADKKDIDILSILWNELIYFHRSKKNIFPISKDWKQLKEKELEWILESKQVFIYVAEVDTKIVGYIRGSIRKIPPLYDIRNEGNIEEIYIMPEYRNRGLATQLVHRIIEAFKHKEVDYIDINVDCDNEIGQKFWESIGFKIISIHRRYLIGGGEENEFSVE